VLAVVVLCGTRLIAFDTSNAVCDVNLTLLCGDRLRKRFRKAGTGWHARAGATPPAEAISNWVPASRLA